MDLSGCKTLQHWMFLLLPSMAWRCLTYSGSPNHRCAADTQKVQEKHWRKLCLVMNFYICQGNSSCFTPTETCMSLWPSHCCSLFMLLGAKNGSGGWTVGMMGLSKEKCLSSQGWAEPFRAQVICISSFLWLSFGLGPAVVFCTHHQCGAFRGAEV